MVHRFPIAIVLVGVLAACVGSDPAPSSQPDTNADGGSSGASSSGSSGSSGGARSITCDATSSCTGADKCCGVGTDWIGSSCKPDCGGAYSLTCDDAKDCGAGEVCCYTTDGGSRATTSFCAATCRPEKKELQLCALGSTGECRAGTCGPLTEFSPAGLAHCS